MTLRSSQGTSGAQTVLLLLTVAGVLVLTVGLAGDRIAAVGRPAAAVERSAAARYQEPSLLGWVPPCAGGQVQE